MEISALSIRTNFFFHLFRTNPSYRLETVNLSRLTSWSYFRVKLSDIKSEEFSFYICKKIIQSLTSSEKSKKYHGKVGCYNKNDKVIARPKPLVCVEAISLYNVRQIDLREINGFILYLLLRDLYISLV